MPTQSATAADFLGPSLAGKLTPKARTLKISQLQQLRKNVLQHKPSTGALAALSLADLHSIRAAFAPFAEGKMTGSTVATACCCCCSPCCCCGSACSSCSA